MPQLLIPAAVLLIALGATATHAAASITPDGFLTYSGVATDLDTGRKLYAEQHYLRYLGGRIAERVVLYECGDGVPFARKQVTYVDSVAPDFEMVDVRVGRREGLRSDSGQRDVFYRENSRSPESIKRLPAESKLVADAGFDEFVRANWASLMSGAERDLDFLIPSRLSTLGFKVKRVRAAVVAGVPAQMFRLGLSGFLGLVLPAIDVYYSDSEHTLLRYDGLSNIQDSAGKQYKARILFPPHNRLPGDAAALRKAQQVALHACGSER